MMTVTGICANDVPSKAIVMKTKDTTLHSLAFGVICNLLGNFYQQIFQVSYMPVFWVYKRSC